MRLSTYDPIINIIQAGTLFKKRWLDDNGNNIYLGHCYIHHNFIIFIYGESFDKNASRYELYGIARMNLSGELFDLFSGGYYPQTKIFSYHDRWTSDELSLSLKNMINFIAKTFHKFNFAKIYKIPQYKNCIEYEQVIKNLVKKYIA